LIDGDDLRRGRPPPCRTGSRGWRTRESSSGRTPLLFGNPPVAWPPAAIPVVPEDRFGDGLGGRGNRRGSTSARGQSLEFAPPCAATCGCGGSDRLPVHDPGQGKPAALPSGRALPKKAGPGWAGAPKRQGPARAPRRVRWTSLPGLSKIWDDFPAPPIHEPTAKTAGPRRGNSRQSAPADHAPRFIFGRADRPAPRTGPALGTDP